MIAAPGMVYAPGAYDALSARVIEAQGFDVVVAGAMPLRVDREAAREIVEMAQLVRGYGETWERGHAD